MSSNAAAGTPIPPWIQNQIMQFQKTQNELQSIRIQKQHLEGEGQELVRTLEELRKTDEDAVFKFAGTAMIKTAKPKMIEELEERQELGKTRLVVISKQEARLSETLKEQETKITNMIQNINAGRPQQSPPGPPASSIPPPSQQPPS